jgi:hypothetical protein
MKLAIAISGPPRNILQMLSRVEKDLISIDYKADVFVHLWRQDGGTKARSTSCIADASLLDKIQSYSCIKSLSVESPFCDDDYKLFPRELLEEGQSNVAAVMGMFVGVNRLISNIKVSPIQYSHVLRLRTDCILIQNNFFKHLSELDKSKTYVSKNYQIPHAWLSDHIMFAPLDSFAALWELNSWKSFFERYRKAGANPERYLANMLQAFNFIDVEEKWLRYQDYHILYDNRRLPDPSWVERVNSKNIYEVFEHPEEYIGEQGFDEIHELLAGQKKNIDYYAKPKAVKAFIRLWRLLYKVGHCS